MTTPTLKRLLGTAALALALGACDNDSTGSKENQGGDLSFTYSGARSGQFAASGEFDRNDPNQNEFGVAVIENRELLLLAADHVQANRTDVFIISAPAAQGTTTCTPTTQFADCTLRGYFAVGFTDPNDQEPDAQYLGYVGSIQLTELRDNRVRGTFSLLLEDQNGDNTVQARSGSFDLPIVAASAISPNRSPVTAATLNRVLSRR